MKINSLQKTSLEKPLRILILEDSADDVDLVERELRRGGIDFATKVVKKKEDYERELLEFNPHIILSDHSLPQFNSIEAMRIWQNFQQKNGSMIPFILITGTVSEEFAVQSIKAGADDYILKDRLKRLPSSVKSALERVELERQRHDSFSELLAQTSLMKEAEHLANFGSLKVDLLTGKHQWSDEAFRIFGFEAGQIQPDYNNFFKHVHPDDKERLRMLLDQTVRRRRFQQCEYRIIDNKNNVKTLLSRIIVKRNPQGQAYELIGFTIDISEQRQQTHALELQNQKLSDIAWVQSHEVRAPLARLMGLAGLLQRFPHENDEFKMVVSHILESATELDSIVRKIVRKTEELS